MDTADDTGTKDPATAQHSDPKGLAASSINSTEDANPVEETTKREDVKEEPENGQIHTSQEERNEVPASRNLQQESRENKIESVASPRPSSHVRTTSKVEVIEAPNRPRSSYNSASMARSSSPSAPALCPEDMQHRHDDRKDQASSYQPSPPKSYMQLRAVALQLPNIASTSNASHTDPPTIIMEGRTNLSSARRSFYPKVTRTLPELHLWLLALTLSFPASIFSPFEYPPPALINGGTSTDSALRDYLVTITNQLGRIMNKQYVLSHPATVALVDCDFSYTPSLPHVGPGSSPLARRRMEEGLRIARSGFDPLRGKRGKGGSSGAMSTWDVDGVAAALGLPTSVFAGSNDATVAAPSTSKNPLSLFSRANSSPQRIQVAPPVALPPGEEDEDEEDLTLARNEITRLEMQFEKASQSAQMVLEKSGALSATLNQLTQALANLERLDAGRVIAKRSNEEEITKIMIRGIEAWSAAEAGASSTMVSTITPSLAYQSFNARMAIDALLRRAAAATHRHSALVVLVQKRREAERLKRARGEIRQEEVDWVLSELKDAQRTTNLLTHHLATFTATLKDELKNHSRFTHNDVQSTLLGHARNSIRAHKFLLNNLKRARDELLAKKEGRSVQEVGETPTLVTSKVASIVPTVKEEQPVRVIEQEAVATQVEPTPIEDKSEPILEAERKDEAAASALSSVDSTLSRDKALPVAPIDDGGLVEQDQASTVGTEETLREEQAHSQAQDKPVVVEAKRVEPPLFTRSNDASSEVSPGITQSGFLPPPSPPPPQNNESPSKMTQSAFLPARNMDRYANPFARLDPSLATTPAAPIKNNTSNNHTDSSNNNNSTMNGKAKATDVWANRSRLSASDAARSLAGRF